MDSLPYASLPLLIAQTALIVALARTLGLGARRLGQPMVVAEIAAGILLGPSLLGWIAPKVSATLFPASSMALLGTTSHVGLILFMFLIGLELDPKLLRGRARSSVAISYASIIVPFGLGALLAWRFLAHLMPAGEATISFVLFVGATMSITAFSVLARILVERRLHRSHIGAIAIASAAVDDVSAWCILAFVVSVARASSAARAMTTLGLAVVYIAVMILAVRPALERIAQRTRSGLSHDMAALVLVGVLVSSWTTEVIGIHAVFGAFLFGAVFPKKGTLAAALAEKVEDIVVVLLVPLFFAYSGLRTHIGLLDSPRAWLTCAAIVIVACAGKFGGSYVAGRLTGLTAREAGAVGVLMNTRGLMELLVLNIGLDLGVISPALFTMMVVMALVTTVMTTPLLNVIYPMEQLARQIADAPLPPRAHPAAPAAAYTAIVCVAHEEMASGLLTVGAAAAGASTSGSRVYALRLTSGADRASTDGAEALAEYAPELDVELRPLSFVSSDPGKDICDVAGVKRADVVVLGCRIAGGSTFDGVVRDVISRAPCDVAVLLDRGLGAVRRVLVRDGGEEHDRAALGLAKRIAHNSGAEIVVKDGAEAIIGESGRGFDLLVVGMRAEPDAEAIIARAPTSVLVVRHGEERCAVPLATVA